MFELISANLLKMRLFRVLLMLGIIGLACPTAILAESANLLRAVQNSQLIQNKRADADDLSRMKDVAMIQRFFKADLLVRVPSKTRHYYTRYIPSKYSYLRPWSKLFLDRLSSQYYTRFKKKMRVTSLVRTVALQKSSARTTATPPRPMARAAHLI